MIDYAIRVKNISKNYANFRAVNNLNFDVEKSTCFGILGPNGAGKTTTMKMLYGRVMRDSDINSKIQIFQYDPAINNLEIKYIAGVVPQEDNLDMELSVIQNLEIFARFYGLNKKYSKKRIEELLDFMELTEKSKEKIGSISGGMKRRLLIARAIIHKPKLLILDEPTTGLDPQVKHLIWDTLLNLKNKHGVTLLLTTHYMEEAFYLCDNIMFMNNGEKILEDTPEKLLEKHVESYVLELFKNNVQDIIEKDYDYRVQETDQRIFIYSDNEKKLKKIASRYKPNEFILRKSNLEDLFLKMSGRELNE